MIILSALLASAMPVVSAGGAQLQALSDRYLAEQAHEDPVDVISASGTARRLSSDRDMLGALGRIDRRSLTREEQVDAVLLDNALRYELWRHDRLQDWAWDIQHYQDLTREALSDLPGAEAPAARERLLGAASRFRQMPAFFARIRALIVSARVPQPHAKLVADQNRHLLDGMLDPLMAQAASLAPDDRRSFEEGVAVLRQAVAEQQHWLDAVLLPNATGSFRLGPALYDAKARFEMGTALSRPEIEKRARAAITTIRSRMYIVAKRALEGRPDAPPLPVTPTQAQENVAIRAALELEDAAHPPRSDFVPYIRQTLATTTDFVRKADLVSVPDKPVPIVDMAADMQGIVPAFFQASPRPVYAVSPIPALWDDRHADEYLRSHNDYYLQNLTIHEAMPGHYLQSMHQQANASPLRRALGSRSFAEGWAVYGQQMMVDAGYLADKPLFELEQLKWRLSSTASALLDIGIQTKGWTKKQMIDLFVGDCFETPTEAESRWNRATLTSTQLLTYFIGYTEHMALRDEVKRRDGAAFNLRKYNDAVLAHGMPPVRLLRELLLNKPIR